MNCDMKYITRDHNLEKALSCLVYKLITFVHHFHSENCVHEIQCNAKNLFHAIAIYGKHFESWQVKNNNNKTPFLRETWFHYYTALQFAEYKISNIVRDVFWTFASSLAGDYLIK